MHSVGSIEELKSLSDNCPEDIELHRPYVDAVTFPCPKCEDHAPGAGGHRLLV